MTTISRGYKWASMIRLPIGVAAMIGLIVCSRLEIDSQPIGFLLVILLIMFPVLEFRQWDIDEEKQTISLTRFRKTKTITTDDISQVIPGAWHIRIFDGKGRDFSLPIYGLPNESKTKIRRILNIEPCNREAGLKAKR